ncbi:MAG TPA: hypothetical protein DEP03_18335, partial [Massilia sp.]|nr:hypothetical protein [Massilia sp.]
MSSTDPGNQPPENGEPVPRKSARGHDWRHAMRSEFSDWQLWWARAVMVALAVISGLVIVGFTALAEYTYDLFAQLHARWWWSPLLWTPLVACAVVWCTRRFAPGAAGSGIPQVMAALEVGERPAARSLFVSLRLSFAKILL